MTAPHERIQQLIPDYLNGTLPEGDRPEVEEHLRDCAECREDLALLSSMTAAGIPDPGELFWKTLPQRVRARAGEQRRRRSWFPGFLLGPLPWAAAVALFVMVWVKVISLGLFSPPMEYVTAPFAASLDVDLIGENDLTPLAGEMVEALAAAMPANGSIHGEITGLTGEEAERLHSLLKSHRDGKRKDTHYDRRG